MPKNKRQQQAEDHAMLNQSLQQALRQQRDGNLAAAQRKCRSILQKAPNHGETLHLLAILMQQSGDSRSALHFMKKALKTAPEDPQLLKNLAEIHRSRGDFEQAQHYAQAALEIAPDSSDALFISGAVFLQQGKRQQAIEQFARVVAICPDDAEAHNELGNMMCADGDLASAINHYQLALEARPDFVDCRSNLADTLVDCGDIFSAINHFQQVLESEPYNARIHNQLGQAFSARGDNDSAISCFELALEQNPLLLEARLNLGKIHLESDSQQAENWFKSVLDIDPKFVEGYYWLGILFQTLGRFERATNYLLQASRIDPEFSFAWYRLSLDRGFRPSPQQMEMLEQQYKRSVNAGIDDENLIALDFTLGRFHEQRGAYATAFKYYRHGNELKLRAHHFDGALHDAQIDNVINIFNKRFFEQRDGWGIDTDTPIFVIGMPRSGTTLVQQILSSHSQVHGAGELPLMLELASSLTQDKANGWKSHARRVAALDRGQVVDIALEQLEKMQSLAPEASHIVDKLPGNYFRLGLIRLLFPKAKIIHCQREPMDTCWSCYQQNFESGLNFSNDFKSLGQAYCGYRRLMAHWHRLFPDQILDLDYEELVQNPKTVSRQILRHCALPWQPQVVGFQNLEQPVNTASLWQARQPIYQSSIGRWKSYRQFLEPLAQQISSCR